MSFSPVKEPPSAPSSTPRLQAVPRRAPLWKWNPYTDTPLPSLLTSGVMAEETMSIPALVEMYEQQVTALVNSHEEIMFVKSKVQEAINEMRFSPEKYAKSIACRNDKAGPAQIAEQNSELHLLKQGLDLRLRQFAEDCQSASKLEWILRRKLNAAEDKHEISMQQVTPPQVQPTCEAMKNIKDQDRLIKLLQHVLDQNLYHNYVYAERLRHIRKECFADELHCWAAIRDDSAWFEGKEIGYEVEGSSHLFSSWMRLIRTHPTPEPVPQPPRADPHSLSFISRMHEIDQLASAVAKEGHKYTKLDRQRDLTQLQGQLTQLRKVLAGAAATASGIEKVILKNLTSQVDERISYPSHVGAQRRGGKTGAEAAVTEGHTPDTDRVTKPLGLQKVNGSVEARAPSYSKGRRVAESTDKRKALQGLRRVSSKSMLRQGTIITPLSGSDALPKISPAPLPWQRRSLTSLVDIGDEKAKSVAGIASRDGVLERRKLSFSSSVASPPPLRRGASRTVPSPRHSFQEEVRRSPSGTRETARKLTEDFLPYAGSDTAISQAHGADREEARIGDASSVPFKATILRGGSRTVPSPQRTRSQGSLTLRSPREHQSHLVSTPLSRALSSAFLGG